ncbi:MAG: RnfABCDGE type electron transport complex subunit D [Clostridiales bacterium]|nr:RnfABCDGE type electron transport complex subunit D [Clostridiales bacterium]
MKNDENDKLLLVTGTPHVRDHADIEKIMGDVIIALLPACVMGAYTFGPRAAAAMLVSVASCVFFEYLFEKITKRPVTIRDLSAVVTGLLLAMNLPPTVPLWLPAVGGAFAIIVVKQLFGGLGQNFMNPALAARAFLLASYPALMTNWVIDGVSSATPLARLKAGGFTPQGVDYFNAAAGHIGGCIGETSAIALIIGGAYLLAKGVVSWRIPFAYLAVFALFSAFFGRPTGYELLTGGLLLGAFFMATDYSSSPVSPLGQLAMGAGCGALTALIRSFGGYPEGVSYSILLMNLAVPLLDKIKPRVYGHKKR